MRHDRLARSFAAAALALALPAAGCFGAGASANADPSAGDDAGSMDDGTPEPEPGVDDPYSGRRIPTDPLAACTEGLSPTEIEDALAITFDFEVSAHEMVACGGLVFGIVGALVEGIVELVEDPTASTLPDGYRFDDQGTYYVEPATFNDLRMEVRFYLGRDYSFGSEGELVTQNLFVMSTYLRNPHTEIHVDTSSGWPVVEVEITHEGPGPLVELLGLGPNPPSPIVVSEDELEAAQAHLGDMKVEAIIFFADHPGVSTIEYDVEPPLMLARTLLTGSPMDLAMVGADGWRADLEQDLDVDAWTVEYADGVGALVGDIDFTVRGGPFDFVSRFHYDASGWPAVSLACAAQ
jgi:hypothetical protein